MGSLPSPAERSSLDRLKALDTLPDVAAQLAEVNELCTHRARADMITKWLLEKLKSSPTHKSNYAVWQSLQSTLRLLSPDRLTSLLTSSAFFSTLDSVLMLQECSQELLQVLADVVNFLFEASTDPNGTAIQALLSLPAPKAAPLAGHWLEVVSQGLLGSKSSSPQHLAVLGPAIRIWNARKRSNEDDSLFAKYCQSPAAFLLALFSKQTELATGKRKRRQQHALGGNETYVHDDKATLQALLARHIFLPARAAFLRSSDSVTTHSRSAGVTQHQEATISEILDPLQQEIYASVEKQQIYLSALPQLFHIALQCTSTRTPRQQMKEQPWIEAVFRALHGCNKTAAGDLLDPKVLIDMLKAVRDRASLPRDLLEELLRSHSNLTSENKVSGSPQGAKPIEWALVAQIIDLDAFLFIEAKLAKMIFSSLTKADNALRSLSGEQQSEVDFDDTSSRKRNLWLNGIIVPVMNAFAQNRDLATFIDLWLQQLISEHQDGRLSIWSTLDSDVEAVLRECMTKSQLVSFVDSLFLKISSACNKGNGLAEQELDVDLDPSMIVLRTILRGFPIDSLPGEVALKCEDIFDVLMRAVDSLSGSAMEHLASSGQASSIWSLMSTTLETWFPDWAAIHRDPALVARRLNPWISGTVLNKACDIIQSPNELKVDSRKSARTLGGATVFIARILDIALVYSTHMDEKVQTILGELEIRLLKAVGNNDDANLGPLLQHSRFLDQAADPSFCKNLLDRSIDGPSPSHTRETETVVRNYGLEALAAAARICKQGRIIEAFVTAAVDVVSQPIQNPVDQPSNDRQRAMLFRVFQTDLANSLTRDQRERILDASVSSASLERRLDDRSMRDQLPLMVKLMEKPNATANISTDPTIIWRLAKSGLGSTEGPLVGHTDSNPDQMAQSIPLLEELGKLLLRQLLATQEQERSHKFLINMSNMAKKTLELECESQIFIENLAVLALSTVIIRELESGSKPGLLQQLPHRDGETMTKASETSLTSLNELLLQDGSTNLELLTPSSGSVRGDLLADLLSQSLMICSRISSNLDDMASRVAAAISSILDTDYSADAASRVLSAPLFRCYVEACQHISSKHPAETVNEIALRTLATEKSPQQIDLLLESYSEYVKKLDGGSRVRLAAQLLSKDWSLLPTSLPLLQRCIRELCKDDFSMADGNAIHQLLHKLLDFASKGHGPLVKQQLTACIITVLKDKPFLTNQHTIEMTLTTVIKQLDTQTGLSLVFRDVCQMVSTLLSSHRARLHGRFHLMNQVFQKLISTLLQDSSIKQNRPRLGRPLDQTHAYTLSRIIVLFCEPPNIHAHSKSSDLVDESRKEQAYVGQYVQSILHHYCAQVLHSAPTPAIRDALRPAVWAMIDAILMADSDGMQSLSASMNNSERAILRGVYDDWKRFGKWRGR